MTSIQCLIIIIIIIVWIGIMLRINSKAMLFVFFAIYFNKPNFYCVYVIQFLFTQCKVFHFEYDFCFGGNDSRLFFFIQNIWSNHIEMNCVYIVHCKLKYKYNFFVEHFIMALDENNRFWIKKNGFDTTVTECQQHPTLIYSKNAWVSVMTEIIKFVLVKVTFIQFKLR